MSTPIDGEHETGLIVCRMPTFVKAIFTLQSLVYQNNYYGTVLQCDRFLQDYISDLTMAILKNNDEDFILECVGILANLTISDLDYELLLREYDLIPWIHNKLKPGVIITSSHHHFVSSSLCLIITLSHHHSVHQHGQCSLAVDFQFWMVVVLTRHVSFCDHYKLLRTFIDAMNYFVSNKCTIKNHVCF